MIKATKIKCDNNPEKKDGAGKTFLGQMAFGTAFLYLTSGVFLSGLAILMGAGNVLVIYISVIANICGVLILFLGNFIKRFRSRKKLAISLMAISKLVTFFIVAIPLLFSKKLQIFIFIPTVITAFTLQAQTTVVLNNWMIAVVSGEKRGRYISLRQTVALIVTVTLSLSSGYLLDSLQGKYLGFAIVFSVALLMGILEIFVLLRVPDSIAESQKGEKNKLRDMVRLPLRDRPYRTFILYVFFFYLLLNVSDSFTMVYMLRYLQLSYKQINIMSLIMSVPQIVLLSMWGKICDKKGHGFALKTSIWMFALQTMMFALSSGSNWFVMLPISFFIASVGNAGFSVAVFNRRYELMPKESRIIYDNFYSAAVGLGVILGPFLGAILNSLIELSPTLMNFMQFASIRFLYILSTIGLIVLQLFFARAKKKIFTAGKCLYRDLKGTR